MDSKKPSLLEYIKEFSGWITGVITFLTMLVAFVVLLRDNRELMTVLIIITFSAAAMVASFRVITEKIPPLIAGGKDYPKYPKLRRPGMVILIVVPIVDLIFFFSRAGKDLVTVSLYSAETPTSTLSFQSTSTLLPSPALGNVINTSTNWGCKPFNLIIPTEIDLSQPEFQLADILYSQSAWENWETLELEPVLTINLTNIQPKDGNTIRLSNYAQIVIDSYQPLDHLESALFSRNGYYFGGHCGGGGIAREFSEVYLGRDKSLFSSSREFDYFTLQPGESEEFYIPFRCGEPGTYQYHITVDASFLDQKRKIDVSDSLITYCPKTISFHAFEDVDYDTTNQTYNIHTIVYSGGFELNNQGKYVQSSKGKTVTEPWRPCTDSPDSYIFPMGMPGMINPTNNSAINIRSAPGLDSNVVDQISPGQGVHIEDGPSCENNLVWWQIFWSEPTEGGDPIVHGGWIAEGDEKERWLVSCPGKEVGLNLSGNSDGIIEPDDWCR